MQSTLWDAFFSRRDNKSKVFLNSFNKSWLVKIHFTKFFLLSYTFSISRIRWWNAYWSNKNIQSLKNVLKFWSLFFIDVNI